MMTLGNFLNNAKSGDTFKFVEDELNSIGFSGISKDENLFIVTENLDIVSLINGIVFSEIYSAYFWYRKIIPVNCKFIIHKKE